MASCNFVLRFLVLTCMIAALACTGGTMAQEGITIGFEETLLLTEPEKAGFNRIFETTADHKRAVDDLVTAATARLRQEEKKAEAASTLAAKEFRALPEEQRRSPEARKALSDKLAAIGPGDASMRRALLGDLRALLSEQQQESWRKFVYFLRREKNRTYHGGWYRDHTNVLALVDALGLTKEERAPLAEMLDNYEHDLDGAFMELDAAEAELSKAMAKAREEAGGDQELLRQNYEAARRKDGRPHEDAAHRLARLNWQYVRRLSAVLSEGRAGELAKLWETSALREALGPNQSDLAMRAAPELPGLDEATRGSIRKIVDEYVRAYEPLTRRIAVMEKSLLLGDDSADMTQWDPTRLERGALVSKAHESVRAKLTEAQFEAVLREGRKRADEWQAKMSR